MPLLAVFLTLQAMDAITTAIGLMLGGVELNPFVRWWLQFGTLPGLVAVKGIALILALTAIRCKRARVVGWINIFFAALVMWNLAQIARAV
jgi:hypothetical protein